MIITLLNSYAPSESLPSSAKIPLVRRMGNKYYLMATNEPCTDSILWEGQDYPPNYPSSRSVQTLQALVLGLCSQLVCKLTASYTNPK